MAEKAYFISDLHLGSDKEPNSFLLIDFLKKFKSTNEITHLFLLGDIFDLWISNHQYYIKKYALVLGELTRLKSLGVQIHYFEGNHDLYIKDYFGRVLGFHIHHGPAQIEILGKNLRLEHGDQMDPSDYGYILLRWFWRTPLLKWLAPRLPQRLVVWIGESSSRKSSQYTRGVNALNSERAKKIIHAHVESIAADFDMHISGHVHVIEDSMVKINNKNIRVVNLGSWFDGARVFQMTSASAGFINLK